MFFGFSPFYTYVRGAYPLHFVTRLVVAGVTRTVTMEGKRRHDNPSRAFSPANEVGFLLGFMRAGILPGLTSYLYLGLLISRLYKEESGALLCFIIFVIFMMSARRHAEVGPISIWAEGTCVVEKHVY